MGLVITAFIMVTLLSVSAVLRVEANENRRVNERLEDREARFLA